MILPAARAADHPVDRLLQRGVGDQRAVLAGGEQRGLVDHVGQVGAGHADGALGQRQEVDVGRERLALGVHGQDGLPAREVGRADRDLPVEPARPQQRRVQDVRPVGGGDQDDAALGVEAVHLDQQLVQRLLALVVPAAHAGAALPADGVDLVDEDDARRVLLGLLEQVAHPGGADADEHLDEVRAGDRVERHAGLAGDRAGQQRLAGAGRAVEQHALGDLGAERLVAGRVLQEVLDLVELLDGLVGAGHVGELGLRHVLGQLLGLGLAERHHLVAAALGVVHHPEQDEQHQAERDQVDQHRGQEGLLVTVVLNGRLVLRGLTASSKILSLNCAGYWVKTLVLPLTGCSRVSRSRCSLSSTSASLTLPCRSGRAPPRSAPACSRGCRREAC